MVKKNPGFLHCDGDRTMGNLKKPLPHVPAMRRGEELRFTDSPSVD